MLKLIFMMSKVYFNCRINCAVSANAI